MELDIFALPSVQERFLEQMLSAAEQVQQNRGTRLIPFLSFRSVTLVVHLQARLTEKHRRRKTRLQQVREAEARAAATVRRSYREALHQAVVENCMVAEVGFCQTC